MPVSVPAGRFDRRLATSLRAVGLTAVALALGALAAFGRDAAISVGAGGALAGANLWVMAKVVASLLPDETAPAAGASGRAAWALVAALKMVALLSVVWLLMRHGLVQPLPMLAGLLSLPFGIAIGSLVSDRNAA